MFTGDPVNVPADDRAEANEPDAPGTPYDLKALKALWRDRDVEYAKRSCPLTDEQVETIREFRRREANDLPISQRGRAGIIVKCWWPPQHGQGAMR